MFVCGSVGIRSVDAAMILCISITLDSVGIIEQSLFRGMAAAGHSAAADAAGATAVAALCPAIDAPSAWSPRLGLIRRHLACSCDLIVAPRRRRRAGDLVVAAAAVLADDGDRVAPAAAALACADGGDLLLVAVAAVALARVAPPRHAGATSPSRAAVPVIIVVIAIAAGAALKRARCHRSLQSPRGRRCARSQPTCSMRRFGLLHTPRSILRGSLIDAEGGSDYRDRMYLLVPGAIARRRAPHCLPAATTLASSLSLLLLVSLPG